MKMRLSVVLLLAAAMLGGCASNRRCLQEQDYQKARSVPPPAAVGDLTVPESASALRIPPEPDNAVAFGREVRDPKDPDKPYIECLDVPPPLAAEPAEPAAPAGS